MESSHVLSQGLFRTLVHCGFSDQLLVIVITIIPSGIPRALHSLQDAFAPSTHSIVTTALQGGIIMPLRT